MEQFKHLVINWRLVWTAGVMFVFFWLWPLRLFARHNNCYFYTLEHLIRYGGKVKWYEDTFWFGYHCTWLHNGVEYSYDMTRAQRQRLKAAPWYYIPIFYEGRVRKRKIK